VPPEITVGGGPEGSGPTRRGSRIPALAGWALALVALVLAVVASVSTSGGGRSAAKPPGPPTTVTIARVMWRTVLVGEPFEHFYPAGQPTTIPDRAGGYLTAVIGVVQPTTDGNGQLVFFWHDRRFVGWGSPIDSLSITQLGRPRTGGFEVTYSNYAPGDPACCPSLVPLRVVYRWNGRRMVPDGDLPAVAPSPGRVRLMHN